MRFLHHCPAVDGEFAPLKILIESMPGGSKVNLASANEHAPEIERRIWVVKERSRSSRHDLPFQWIRKLLTTQAVMNSVRMLSFFPTKGEMLDCLIPETVMTGEVLKHKKHSCLQVGQHWRDSSHTQCQRWSRARFSLRNKTERRRLRRTVASGNKQRGCAREEDAPDIHEACVTKDKNGVAQLLVQRQSALHGTMVASMLQCWKFAKSLMDINFVMNPCDWCMANVDNLKASHVKVKVMDRMIKHLRQEHQSAFEDGSGAMAVSQGKIHKHLGMTLNHSLHSQVKISRFERMDKTLTAFDKVEPNGAGTQSSGRSFLVMKLPSFTTSWLKRCTPPSKPGRTPPLPLLS